MGIYVDVTIQPDYVSLSISAKTRATLKFSAGLEEGIKSLSRSLLTTREQNLYLLRHGLV